ncbi:hypothetical protein CMUS01_16441 [Colletotrichum musicola]|uniref:Heterokaryon incompatibility domain-containing protein n=1 Tax=Colletotrichum musicola TaxID=2175873 RepID=A0A8H6MI57_9PEZI|nr:hypothetical protein CMUS01_16441 [Colletotrichum musicola]
MVDDLETENDSALSRPDFMAEIKTLYHTQVHRAPSQLWALRDISFPVFDDTDIKLLGYDSDDEEATLMHAIKMSMQEEGDEQPCLGEESGPMDSCPSEAAEEAGPSSSASQPQVPRGTSDKDDKEYLRSCAVCKSVPLFPQDRRPRKLRLFRPRDELPSNLAPRPCIHYVAVSYCWRSRHTTLPKASHTYRVRELDGTIRENRAEDDVIDRAIEVARRYGLRMIWLDKECLPQEGEDDREVGLQAMELSTTEQHSRLGCMIL